MTRRLRYGPRRVRAYQGRVTTVASGGMSNQTRSFVALVANTLFASPKNVKLVIEKGRFVGSD